METYAVSVVDVPRKQLLGIRKRSTMAKAGEDCPALWQRFGPMIEEFTARGGSCLGTYGACAMVGPHDFDYWAALEPGSSAVSLAGTEQVDIPAGRYAKCRVPNLSALGDVYMYLYQRWPGEQKDFAVDCQRISFEAYPERWQVADSFDVYIPVQDSGHNREEALRLLEPGRPVFLVTSGDKGRLDARAMAAVKCEGLKTIWMLTGKCSDKYRELSRDGNCLLYATEFADTTRYLELRLWGTMALLDDAASRALAWKDEYLAYFPGGKDDPNLVVLKFTAASGVVQTRAGKEHFTL